MGLVEPPINTIVNNTITSVVLTNTFLISSSNGKCSARANAIAPLNPEIVEHLRKFGEELEIIIKYSRVYSEIRTVWSVHIITYSILSLKVNKVDFECRTIGNSLKTYH